jgi:uncharacterized protein (TIGR03067 family)
MFQTIAVLLAPLLAQTDDVAKVEAAERKKLLGAWVAVSWEMEGKALTPADLKRRGLQAFKMTFRADSVTQQSLGLLQCFRYRLEPTKTPKEIDMELTPAGDLDISFRGIYKLEGDTLTLCEVLDGRGRAKEFATVPRHASRLVVLKRQKDVDPIDAALLSRINQAEAVFTAKVTRKGAPPRPDAPPTLEFAEVKVLRGRTKAIAPPFEPALPDEKETRWLVVLNTYKHIDVMLPVNDRLLALSEEALALPLGWTLEGGRPLSPWTSAWPMKPEKGPVCGKTSRPALLAGDAIDIEATQVMPPRVDAFRNPYGDGQFKVTVTNRGDKPVSVPALVSDGKNVLWADSLLLLDISTVANNGAACLLPGEGAVAKAKEVQPVVLKAKESLATIVDVLHARGVMFQPGGARYYYRFCLGEKSATSFFYYSSSHHDALRTRR